MPLTSQLPKEPHDSRPRGLQDRVSHVSPQSLAPLPASRARSPATATSSPLQALTTTSPALSPSRTTSQALTRGTSGRKQRFCVFPSSPGSLYPFAPRPVFHSRPSVLVRCPETDGRLARHSSPTIRTLPRRLITSSRTPTAMAALGARACVSAAISPSAPV